MVFYLYEGCFESTGSYFIFMPTMSEVDVGGMVVELEPSHQYSILLPWDIWQQRASDKEVCMKQMCVTEFLCVGKMAPADIHWLLLSIHGDQTVNVSTVRWCVLRFSSGDSSMKESCSGCPCRFLQALWKCIVMVASSYSNDVEK